MTLTVAFKMHSAPEETNPPLLEGRIGSPRSSARDRRRVALVVERDPEIRRALVSSLRHPELEVLESAGAEDALPLLRGQPFDLILAGQQLDGGCGIELLESVRRRWPETRRALIAERGDMPGMCDAVNRAGVTYLLAKPFEPCSMDPIRKDLMAESAGDFGDERKSPRSNARYGIIGESPAIHALVDLIEKIARTHSTVLVTGETGTGKELVGHAIHQASTRSNRVFSAINSAALPETLLESELFGHRRGSFTGASTNRRGLFEYADGGTVFLDELGEMPLSMQAKLLRFLQTGEIRPVGGESVRVVDVRLVSATNKNL